MLELNCGVGPGVWSTSAAILLGTPALGVQYLGVPINTPHKHPLCTPSGGVQPQSSIQNGLEFWIGALRGVNTPKP